MARGGWRVDELDVALARSGSDEPLNATRGFDPDAFLRGRTQQAPATGRVPNMLDQDISLSAKVSSLDDTLSG